MTYDPSNHRSRPALGDDIGERTALLHVATDKVSEQIRQAHHEWLAALDTIQDPIFMHDAECRVTRSNRAYADLAGLTVKEVLGRPYYEMFPRLPGPTDLCRGLLQEGGSAEEEIAVGDKVFLSRSAAVKDEAGRYLYSMHIMYDITERKRGEKKLIRLNRALRTIGECNHTLVFAADELQLLRDMCRIAVDEGGYAAAWVGYAEHDAAQRVRPVAQHGFETGRLESQVFTWADGRDGQWPGARALRSGEVQVAQDAASEPWFADWRVPPRAGSIAACIALPLRVDGKVMGVLDIFAREAGAFDADEVRLLQEFADDLAFGVGTVRMRREQERILKQLNKELEGTVEAVASMVEMRDPYTAGHERRVAELAAAIARELGLPEARVRGLRLAGIIHDLGKIQVPAEILTKPSRLTNVEYSLIQQHPRTGFEILKNIEFPWPIAQMILQHHERLDGSGYPQGLKGEEILLEARILAVSDVVEAMASHRPYRPGLGLATALDEIAKHRGSHYDPAVVDACTRLFRDNHYRLPEAWAAQPAEPEGAAGVAPAPIV